MDAETAEDPSQLGTYAPNETQATPALTTLTERLLFTPPGRYLRLRLTLTSDGAATPSVRSVRVFYPRVTYLDLLPRVYRRDPDAASFMAHFLALFEHVLTGVEDRYEAFARALDPAASPAGVIDWLASLVDLAFDPSWSLARKRLLLESIVPLYAARGTVRGLERYVEIYTGVRPVIVEGFLERPFASPAIGLGASTMAGGAAALGATTLLTPPLHLVGGDALAEDALDARFAHRFTVYVYSSDECADDVLLAVVDRIVATNKPAHTVHTLRLVGPDARVGVARVGLDVMLGARDVPGTQLGGCPDPASPGAPVTTNAGILGVDSVLGDVRPDFVRPLPPRL